MAAKIPDNVDPKGSYMLTGAFLNQILDCLREQRIFLADESGPLQIRERGPLGTAIALNTDTCPS